LVIQETINDVFGIIFNVLGPYQKCVANNRGGPELPFTTLVAITASMFM